MSAATLRQSLTTVRSRMRIEESEGRRSGAAYASAAVIGILSKPNDSGEVMLRKLEFWGMPGSVTLALAAKAGATFATGDMVDYLNGIGDAAAIVAIANFVQGRTVEGVEGHGRTRAQIEEALRRRLRQSETVDEDLDAELAALGRR